MAAHEKCSEKLHDRGYDNSLLQRENLGANRRAELERTDALGTKQSQGFTVPKKRCDDMDKYRIRDIVRTQGPGLLW